MKNILQRLATGRNVIISLLAYAAMIILVMNPAQAFIEAHSKGTAPIDLIFFYSPSEVCDLLSRYDAAAMTLYRGFIFTGDLVYPFLYTLFFGLAFNYFLVRAFPQGHFMHRWWFIPFVPILFDFMENIFIARLIDGLPACPGGLSQAAASASALKWAFAFLTIGLTVTALAGWGIGRLKNKKEL